MKGTASVNPVFEDYGMNLSNVYSVDPLIATDNHRLYFKSAQISVKWSHKSIISCCHSSKYGCILALSEEGRLHVFTEELE